MNRGMAVEVLLGASPAAGTGTFFCREERRKCAAEEDNNKTENNTGIAGQLGTMMLPRSFAFRTLGQQYPRSYIRHGFQSSPTWRYFSSSIPRAKAAVKPQQPRNAAKPSAPEETLKFAGRRPEGFGKLERKVAKEGGTMVLFKAPSHRSYVWGAYSLAAFCFAYSVYNSNAVFRDPIAVIPMWQQTLFGGVCVVMSIMGTVFLVKTGRLIQSVNAISTNGKTSLRFTVRSMVPFRKPFEFDALPRQIAFSRRLVVAPEYLNKARQPEAPRPREDPTSTITILKSPAKKISITLWKFFTSVRKIFTQEDFVLLEVEGQKGVFRMDSSGYVSEDFLVIGNPVSTRR